LSPAGPPHVYGDNVVVDDMLDPHGRNPKDRPCVVVTDRGSTPEGYEVVVAISTVLPATLPDDYVLLPWHRPHHPKTGLNKRNAAIGRWVEVIEEARIIRKLGIVPDKPLLSLTEIMERMYPLEGESTGE
jgi:hypothetical protein